MRRRFNRGGWRGPGPPTGPFELNRESPQADGLVLWVPTLGNRGGSLLRDMSQYGRNNATLSTSGRPVIFRDPAIGTMLTYDGATSYAEITDNDLVDFTFSEMTVMAWIHPLGWGESNGGRIIEKDGATGANSWGFSFRLEYSGGNFLSFAVNATVGAWNMISDQDKLSLNTTMLVGVSWRGGNEANFYRDGGSVGTDSTVAAGPIAANTHPIRIGNRSSDTARTFDGHIGDVRIYNKKHPPEFHRATFNPATRYDLYKPILPKFVVVAPAAPGGDLSISVSDSVTVSESVTMEVTSFVDVSDSVSAAETVTMLIENIISTSDSISVSEAINLAIAQQIGVSDSVSVTDAPTLMVDENIDVSDSVTVSESVSVSVVDAGTQTITVSDSISVSDTPTLMVDENIDVSDSVTVSESVTMLGTSFIDVSDSVSVSESVSVSLVTVGTLTISVSDSVTVSEAVTMALTPLLINVSESITVADVVTISLLVGLIDLTLRDRDTSLTLRDRDTSLTLNERY